MKKSASILDYSYPFLDPAVWDGDRKLYAYQKDFILRLINTMYETYELKQPKIWVEDIVIIGSLTTVKWLLSSDLDVHIRVNLDAFIASNMPGSTKEEAFAKLDSIRKEFDRAKILLPMSNHPAEFYFESIEFKPSNVALVGVYSLMQDKWLKAPILFEAGLDLEEAKKSAVEAAEALAEELDGSLGKIQRNIKRIDELEQVIRAWGPDKQQLFYSKVEQKLKSIEEEILKDLKIKQDLVDARHENMSATSDNELTFKWLQRFGFFGILSNLKTLLEQTGGTVTTQELPLIEKIISQGTVKEALGRNNSAWISPEGTVFDVKDSHVDWIDRNYKWLQKKYHFVIDNSEGAYDEYDSASICSLLVAEGWTRVGDIQNVTGTGVEVPDLYNVSNAVFDFVLSNLKSPNEKITFEDSEGHYITLVQDEIVQGQKAVNKALQQKRMGSIKEASSFIQDINGVRVYRNPTPEQAVNLFRQSKYRALRYIATAYEDIYMWDASDIEHSQMAEDLGLTEDPDWYNGAGTLTTEDNTRQKAEMFSRHSVASIKEAFLKEAFEEEPKETDTDICVDLDRTLAKPAKHPDIGEPIEGAKESLAKLKELGYNVIIYSCRGDTEEGLKSIEDWMDKHDMPYDSIFSGEKPFYKYLIDDRAIKFDNWESVLKQVEKTEKKASLYVTAYEKKIFQDPTEQQANALLENSKQHMLRWAIGDDGHLYMWDAWYADHPMARAKLGVEWSLENSGYYGERIYPSRLEQYWNKKKVNASISLPVIDPKTLGRKEPYALFIGTGDYGSAGKIDMFNVYGEHPMITKSNVLPTVTLDTLIQNNIPVIGKEPRAGEKQPFQDISGIVKTAFQKEAGYAHAYWLDPNGKIYPVRGEDEDVARRSLDLSDEDTHSGWILRHLDMLQKNYGIDPKSISGTTRSLVELGWTRIGDAYGTDWGIDISNTDNIPSFVDDAIAQFAPEGSMITVVGSGSSRFQHNQSGYTFEWPVKSIQQTVQQLKNRQSRSPSPELQQAAKLFSKRDIIAKTKKIKQGEYGAIMALVPHDIAQEIVEFGVRNIKDSDVFSDEENPRLGRELEPHVTVKYGLLEDNPKTVRRFFNDSKPFKAKLGKVRHFEPPEMEFDVVTVEVISKDLEEMNKKVTDHFKCAHGLVSNEYHPHITLSYVKRGKGKDYVGSDEFEGKEIILDTLIISPRKGNRTYFSIGSDKESSFILEEINKTASGDNFLPSLFNAPNNEFQFEHNGDDEEIALNPDAVDDDTTLYGEWWQDKPRNSNMWKEFISMFKNPFSKNEEMTVDSAYDPELEQKEKDALGEDETLLEYSKGFYDPKKHDFPHNTTWDSLTQDGEPSKPTSVTYSPQISNEDNLDQNSPGGFPRRYMGKPKGEWFSNEGEVNNALIDMLKNREAVLNNITIDITAITRQYALYVGGRLAIRTLTRQKALKICQERFPEYFARGDYEVKEEAYKVASIENIDGLPVLVNPSEQELTNFSQKLRAGRMFRGLLDQHTGDLFVWDAYEAIHQYMIPALGLNIKYSDDSPFCLYFPPSSIGDTLERQQEVKQGKIPRSSSLKQAGDQSASVPDYLDLLTKDITSDILKEAGSYSSTYTDEQGNDFKNEQLYDGIDDVPYVDKNNRDYPFGMRDMNDSSTDYPKPEDIEPYVVRLDILENPSYRLDPFGIGEYNVTWYESLPASDGIEKGNPE